MKDIDVICVIKCHITKGLQGLKGQRMKVKCEDLRNQ